MKRLKGADGLRAFACLLVMFHHAFQKLAEPATDGILHSLHLSFNTAAPAGVSIFFVLSGYLLSKPFWDSYYEGNTIPSMRSYVLRRAGRIIPAFYLVLFVSFIIQNLVFPRPVADRFLRLVAALTFTSGFHWRTFFPVELNGPLWSISYEVFSYLLLPLSMVPLFLAGKGKKSSSHKTVLAVINWIIVFALVFVINGLIQNYLQTDPEGKGWQFGLQGGAKFWMPGYNPLGFYAHFAIGICASFAVRVIGMDSDFQKKVNRFYLFDIISVFFLVGMLYLIFSNRFIPMFSSSFQGQPYFYPVFALFSAVPLAMLPFSRVVGSVIDNPVFSYTAKISFGLYLWHYLLMSLAGVLEVYRFHSADFPIWLLITAICFGVSYLIASLSWFFLEKPVLDRVHRMTSAKK